MSGTRVLILLLLLCHQGIGQTPSIRLHLNDSIHIECKLIAAGEFLMGSPSSDTLADKLEKPQRRIAIKNAFYIGITTVTIQQFRAFIEETGYKTIAETDGKGGHGFNKEKNKFEGLFPQYNWTHTGWDQTDRHPVVNVSWVDATKFCEWLSNKSRKKIRLPSEEEWEYACRAGITSIFFSGDDANSLQGFANVADDALREKLNEPKDSNRTFAFNDGFAFTAPVGSFKPNPWGLYDMTGNVFQLCNGVYSPGEPTREYNNVARGGAYNFGPDLLRSAFRGSVKPTSKYGYIGFRIVVEQ